MVGKNIITKTLNIILPLVGVGLMLAYEYCDTACSYLQGTFLGVDLRWVGVAFMVVLLLSNIFVWKAFKPASITHLRTVLLSAGVGVEFFLVGFQVINDTYCQFCLAFSVCIFVLFGINFNSVSKWIIIASVIAGFFGFALFFEGQTLPRFDI